MSRYVDGLMRTVVVNVAELGDRDNILHKGTNRLLVDLAGLDCCAFTASGELLHVRVYESARDRRAHRP